MKSLNSNFFATLRNFENLYLCDNQLENLDFQIFSNNQSLNNLDLSFNQLDLFSQLSQLDKLDLSVNQLKTREVEVLDQGSQDQH